MPFDKNTSLKWIHTFVFDLIIICKIGGWRKVAKSDQGRLWFNVREEKALHRGDHTILLCVAFWETPMDCDRD